MKGHQQAYTLESSNASFPLTPALSPRERGNRWQLITCACMTVRVLDIAYNDHQSNASFPLTPALSPREREKGGKLALTLEGAVKAAAGTGRPVVEIEGTAVQESISYNRRPVFQICGRLDYDRITQR